jgi:hypothetical protein
MCLVYENVLEVYYSKTSFYMLEASCYYLKTSSVFGWVVIPIS